MNLKKLKKFESEEAPPHAASMIESFRAFGYNLHTAVADIIDNSIFAKARNIWIDFDWNGDKTALVITDDGNGMTKKVLINAMRPGSMNPLLERDPEDLGRFGLGLKSASFSQCRVLTVATKVAAGKPNLRSWNMDYVKQVGKWTLLNYLDQPALIQRLAGFGSGTAVIWQDMDRLVRGRDTDNEEHLSDFLTQIHELEMHLQMVFHVHIEKKKLKIHINSSKLKPWNPFLSNNEHTKLIHEYKLRGGISVASYVLPFHAKLSKEEFEHGSWIKGWNAHQGFYIYRNNRMLIAGEWLGMFKQDEHSKLARIMVNIPASSRFDTEWQLDVKKSTIQLPHDIRQELRDIADDARREAVSVYRQIGKNKKKKSPKLDIPVWEHHKRNGKASYQINRDHPVIKNYLDEPEGNRSKLNRLLRLVEETIPLTMIVINQSEGSDGQATPFEGKSVSDLITLAIEVYNKLREEGCTKEEALEEILRTEPFNHYPELTENLEQQ